MCVCVSSPRSLVTLKITVCYFGGAAVVPSQTSAVLLASQGNSFTEALLWLYRSHGEHRRVLAALLSEDRCVGSGAWTRDGFYRWTADYLKWMW